MTSPSDYVSACRPQDPEVILSTWVALGYLSHLNTVVFDVLNGGMYLSVDAAELPG